MFAQQRKAYILDVLKRDGSIVSRKVSQELDLSEDTVRRDLQDLAAEGLLRRVHGGALPPNAGITDHAGRQFVAPDEKRAIAQAAAKMVKQDHVIFVDGGTTTVEFVRHLPRDLRAMIITHSPNVAVELMDHPNIVVELVGGRIYKPSVVAVGTQAAEVIARYRPDCYFMGITGINVQAGLTTGDSEEAAIKRMICNHAAETIVLASHEKLGVVSAFTVVPLHAVNTLVVGREVSDHTAAIYESAGLMVVRASTLHT